MTTKRIDFSTPREMEEKFAEMQCIYTHCEFMKITLTFALVAVFS